MDAPVELNEAQWVRGLEGGILVPPQRALLQNRDWIVLFLLLLAGLFPVLQAVHAKSAPEEDALMLLRYAEHLAHGQGITWNVGEKPVEGATDFLYMVMVAGASKATGLGVIGSARLIIGASWIALPILVFLSTRLTLGGNFWFCASLAFYLSAGPGGKYVETCFGAPCAALAAGATWWLANELMYRRVTWLKATGMGMAALVLGLIRPEGCILAVLILIAVLMMRPGHRSTVLIGFLACFGTLGLIYFLWRWHYFGYLLPNPFYVKGDGHLYIDGLKRSVGNVSRMLWPSIPIFLIALGSRATRKNLAAVMVPLIGFTAIWILLSNENNHLMRFQFPLVPIVLISLPCLVWGLSERLRLPQLSSLSRGARNAVVVSLVSCVMISMFVYREIYAGSVIAPSSGVVFPFALRQYADKGYTMAVTEAGQFPFYSKWRAIDALGLNDPHIAHFGISESYLDQYKPELMLYHVAEWGSEENFKSALFEMGQPMGPTKEDRAARVMHQYALHHGYILAAAYGDWACNLHIFWIRPGTPDTNALVSYIRNTPYYFLDSGNLSTDYRNNLPKYPCYMPN